jgi:hypothetical protein
MNFAGGAIVVAFGLVMLYVIASGKLECFTGAFKCAFLGGPRPQEGSGGFPIGANYTASLGNFAIPMPRPGSQDISLPPNVSGFGVA